MSHRSSLNNQVTELERKAETGRQKRDKGVSITDWKKQCHNQDLYCPPQKTTRPKHKNNILTNLRM